MKNDNIEEMENAPKRVARVIRKMVLGLEDGAFLGSESDLISILGVSRPTFRQAAKLVEQENLLTIKRGVGGGYFARQPDSRAVAHMTRLFLQSRKATMEHAIEASFWLYEQVAVVGSQRCSDVIRDEFVEFLEEEAVVDIDGKDAYISFLRSERTFGRLFAAASGNPLLELNTLTLYDFAASLEKSLFRANVEQREQYRHYRNKIASAIVESDQELASIFAKRMCNFSLELLKQNHRSDKMPLIVVN